MCGSYEGHPILNIDAALFRSSHSEFMTTIRPEVILVYCEKHIYVNLYMYYMQICDLS